MPVTAAQVDSYATQLHRDIEALTAQVERIADFLELLCGGQPSLPVRQSGPWITREDRP